VLAPVVAAYRVAGGRTWRAERWPPVIALPVAHDGRSVMLDRVIALAAPRGGSASPCRAGASASRRPASRPVDAGATGHAPVVGQPRRRTRGGSWWSFGAVGCRRRTCGASRPAVGSVPPTRLAGSYIAASCGRRTARAPGRRGGCTRPRRSVHPIAERVHPIGDRAVGRSCGAEDRRGGAATGINDAGGGGRRRCRPRRRRWRAGRGPGRPPRRWHRSPRAGPARRAGGGCR
jgi:hypothetical protein